LKISYKNVIININPNYSRPNFFPPKIPPSTPFPSNSNPIPIEIHKFFSLFLKKILEMFSGAFTFVLMISMQSYFGFYSYCFYYARKPEMLWLK